MAEKVFDDKGNVYSAMVSISNWSANLITCAVLSQIALPFD